MLLALLLLVGTCRYWAKMHIVFSQCLLWSRRRLKGPSWHHFADPPHCLWLTEALADRIDAGNERLGLDELK